MNTLRNLLLTGIVVLLAACTANSGPSTSASISNGVNTLIKSDEPPPELALAISPHAVEKNQTATVTWVSEDATTCTASGAWSGSVPLEDPDGMTLGPFPSAGTYTYDVTCTGPGGTGVTSGTLLVGNVPAPVIQFAVAPLQIQPGDSTTILWSTTNATSCTGSGGSGSDGWSAAQSTSELNGFTTQPIATVGEYPYSLTCTGPGGTSEQTAIVTVATSAPAAPPVVSFSAQPTVIQSGQSTQLTWTTGNSTACTASGGTGTDGWNGSQPTSSLGVNIGPLTATGDFSYTLTCNGPGGTSSKSLDVAVNVSTVGSAVDITLAVSPQTITAGNAAALTWTTTNATSCTANGSWSGNQPLSGSGVSTGTLTVPGAYTYTLNCTGAGGSQAATSSASLTVNPAPAALSGFMASPATVPIGNPTDLIWNTTGATSCSATGGTSGDGWGGTVPVSSNGYPIGPFATAGTFSYTLTCNGPGGASPPSTQTVTVTGGSAAAAVLAFQATPSTLQVNGTTQLSWSTSNASTCTGTGGTGTDGWNGSVGTSSLGRSITIGTAGTYTYTLNCTGIGGASGPVSVTVDVAATPPAAAVLAFTATPSAIQVNQATQLVWSTSNATACFASDGTGSDGWTGSVGTSNSGRSITIGAPGSYVYALTCTGPGGNSAPASVEVDVTTAPPLPVISSFTATPSSIQTGQAVSLAWSSTGTSDCTATGGTGSDNWNGSVGTASSGRSTGAIGAAGTYTYTLNCTGTGGSTGPTSLTVNVTTAPPPASIGSLAAMPISLLVGQSTQLSWSSSNASSCTASGGTGTDGWNGTVGTSSAGTTAGPLNAAGTYVYTLTCTGNGGASSPSSVSVTVNPIPPVAVIASFTATPGTITSGQSSTLSWTTTGATSCTAGGGTGSDGWTTGTVATSSVATVVDPTTTVNYTLVCTGPGGSSGTSTATVTVNAPVAGQPTVSLTVNGGAVAQIAPGASPSFSWSSTNATACVASGGTGSDGWAGSRPTAASGVGLSPISTPGVYSYTLTCTGTGGTSSRTVTLTVISSAAANCGIGQASTLLQTPAATAAWSQLSGICVLGCGVLNLDNVIDADTHNFATVWTTVGLGVTLALQVSDAGATFPAGRTVGFVMADNGSLLSLSLLGNLSVVTLLGNNVQETATVSNLLQLQALGLLYDPDAGFVGFKTTKPFNSVALMVNSLASVGSTFKVYGACATLQ